MNTYYYFAYGSNIDEDQFIHRCPYAMKKGIGFLKGYKLFTSHYSRMWEGGVFSIKEKEKSMVYGVLWEITLNDLHNLDYYEGYPIYYDRKYLNINIIGKNNEKKRTQSAIVYISNKIEDVDISEKYLYHCQEAAKKEGITILL